MWPRTAGWRLLPAFFLDSGLVALPLSVSSGLRSRPGDVVPGWMLMQFISGVLRINCLLSLLKRYLGGCLGLDVQRSGVTSSRKLGQGAAREVDVERHDVSAISSAVGVSDGYCRTQLQSGIGCTE